MIVAPGLTRCMLDALDCGRRGRTRANPLRRAVAADAAAGVGAALLTVALAYLLVNSYAIGLSLLRGETLGDDELERKLSSLANLLVWGLPALRPR